MQLGSFLIFLSYYFVSNSIWEAWYYGGNTVWEATLTRIAALPLVVQVPDLAKKKKIKTLWIIVHY